MKALVVGLGSIGRRHGRNLAHLGLEVCGFDPAEDRRAEFCQAVDTAHTFDDFENAVACGSDVAVIASPNIFHVSQATRCAQAGMHLFIEKPLATPADDLSALANAVDGRTVMMGSNWKFYPGFVKAKEIVDSGVLGRIFSVNVNGGQYLPDWHPWEDHRNMYAARNDLGGGVLLDSHEIDYVTWLLGDAVRLSCLTRNTNSIDVETEDLVIMTMELQSGALCTLQLDYLQRPYSRRFQITAENGTLIWDLTSDTLRHYDVSEGCWRNYVTHFAHEYNAMYVQELQHFLQCIDSGEQPETPLRQAVNVAKLISLAHRSAELDGQFLEAS